jgi:PhnB protein
MQLNPYIYFNGDCEAAFKFYAAATGGKIGAMLTNEGSPAEQEVPANWRKKILHASMTIGDQVLFASDAPPGRYSKPQGFNLSIAVQTAAEAEKVFKALAEKGTVVMPMAETFFASRFGMLTDQFGMPWMVICRQN